jgi:hypothetical protein
LSHPDAKDTIEICRNPLSGRWLQRDIAVKKYMVLSSRPREGQRVITKRWKSVEKTLPAAGR